MFGKKGDGFAHGIREHGMYLGRLIIQFFIFA